MNTVDVVTLRDPDGGVEATFVPSVGMIATSLTDGGVELLGQGRGLDAYASGGEFMGIPIMHPWANRLADNTYHAVDCSVTLTPDSFGVQTDKKGLLIHGLLTAYRGWRVTHRSGHELSADLDFAADASLMAGFPFPHRLEVEIRLRDRVLSFRTVLTATADSAVPVCFGFHPYFQLPEVHRADWILEVPAMRHLHLDEMSLPTGDVTREAARTEALGHRVFDDGYDDVDTGAVFAVSGGGRRIEVHFDAGYPAAQIYAPADQDVICFEPMTAPTDALRRGGYRTVMPGGAMSAAFSIHV